MRIAIVNDMVMVVELLKRIVCSVPEYQLAWVAYDGAEAVRRCQTDTPDLILMDLIMPVMGGVEASHIIMRNTPCAILIVTASVLGNISKVFEAMGYGALDVVRTPVLSGDIHSEGSLELLRKIQTIGCLMGKSTPPVSKQMDGDAHLPPLIAIGASTGGPLALKQILPDLPTDLPAAVVVIQHLDSHFIEGFVRWLGERCPLPVELAKQGEVPRKGVISIAGTIQHLTLGPDFRMYYSSEPQETVYKPSVDVFFHSLKEHWPAKGTAVLLTGMGKDGAAGMLDLSREGWMTIAQDRESCVVYGMPKAAIELDAARKVLPLEEIALAIRVSMNAPIKG